MRVMGCDCFDRRFEGGEQGECEGDGMESAEHVNM